jgi:hypothetical protein
MVGVGKHNMNIMMHCWVVVLCQMKMIDDLIDWWLHTKHPGGGMLVSGISF